MNKTNEQRLSQKMRALLYIALGFILGAGLMYTLAPRQGQAHTVEIREKGYTLINPILGFEVAANENDTQDLKVLKKNIQNGVYTAIQQNKASVISVYFRSLNSGRWVGINEDAQFDGASLLKLAGVIAYYKAAENDSTLLTKWYTMTSRVTKSSAVVSQHIPPSETLKIGNSYDAEMLIRRTLEYSDNNAIQLLSSSLTSADITKVVDDLNLTIGENGIVNSISPKTYSFLFRVLYNSTYLARSTSEKLLQVLSESSFKDGIAKGVPSTMVVANKFGERDIVSSAQNPTVLQTEFHDCGIIYYPSHPYFLCVMTKGANYQSQIEAIASISKIIYDARDSYWSSLKK